MELPLTGDSRGDPKPRSMVVVGGTGPMDPSHHFPPPDLGLTHEIRLDPRCGSPQKQVPRDLQVMDVRHDMVPALLLVIHETAALPRKVCCFKRPVGAQELERFRVRWPKNCERQGPGPMPCRRLPDM